MRCKNGGGSSVLPEMWSDREGKFKIGCLGLIALFLIIGMFNSCGSNDNSSQSNKTSSSSSASEQKSKEKVYEDADINVLIKEQKRMQQQQIRITKRKMSR